MAFVCTAVNTWGHWWTLLPSSSVRSSRSLSHVLRPSTSVQVTFAQFQISNREEHTPYSIYSSCQGRGSRVQESFHLTHSTKMGFLRAKLKIFQQMWLIWCKKHSSIICCRCSLHSLSPKLQGWMTNTSHQYIFVWMFITQTCIYTFIPLCSCMHSLSPLRLHTSLSCLGNHHQSHSRFPHSISQPCVHSLGTTPLNKE